MIVCLDAFVYLCVFCLVDLLFSRCIFMCCVVDLRAMCVDGASVCFVCVYCVCVMCVCLLCVFVVGVY